MTMEVTADDLRRAQASLLQSEAQRQKFEGRPTLKVALLPTPPVIDGKLDDWAGADWASIDRSGVAAFFDSHSKPYDLTAAVAVSGDRLYAAFRTGDPQLLRNSRRDAARPFKTGGCLDLMIGADPARRRRPCRPRAGDVRLLGHPGPRQAAGPALPGGRAGHERSGRLLLALADDHHRPRGRRERPAPVCRQRRQLRAVDPAVRAEPQADSRPGSPGDVGILRGDGFETLHRVYWSNKATAITSDVPSEAQLTPRLWGRSIFESTR